MSNKFVSKKRRLVTALSGRGDVHVTVLYRILNCSVKKYPKCNVYIDDAEKGDNYAFRQIQMYIGSIVSILNRSQTKYRIVPGDTRRTYKLVVHKQPGER